MASKKAPSDPIVRVNGFSPVGTAFFIIHRCVFNPWLSYTLFKQPELLRYVGLGYMAASKTTIGTGLIPGLGPIPSLVMIANGALAARQGFYFAFQNRYVVPFGFSVIVSTFNLVCDTITTISTIAVLARATSIKPTTSTYISLAACLGGILYECIAEFQRGAWRSKHPGKVYTGGLWSLCRSPNCA